MESLLQGMTSLLGPQEVCSLQPIILLAFNFVTCRSYDSPLHHHLAARRRRRPHHLHPLNAPAAAGSKQPRTTKARSHPRSYTYHYNQQRQLDNNSQTMALSNHRRSQSHVIPSSWRTELYYEPDITYNPHRGAF